MASSSLTAQPLGQEGGFNWVFLIDMIVCGILAVFFLFYFNRLFATVISYGIRAYTWHKYRAYIDISSLQISLLGGRLFFKSIRYHGHNETVFVHDGNITWRYWIRQVQDAEVFQAKRRKRPATSDTLSDISDGDFEHEQEQDTKRADRNSSRAEAGNIDRQQELPCRIFVKVSGAEVFLYNQTPVYDNILATLAREHGTAAHDSPDDPLGEKYTASRPATGASQDVPLKAQETKSSISDSFIARSVVSTDDAYDLPAFLRLFPIQIDCKKAAVAVGNEHTPAIITAKLEHASGRVDVGESGPMDLYKLLFKFDFNDVLVSMKPNHDFHMFQLQAAARVQAEGGLHLDEKGEGLFGYHPLRRLRKILRFFRRPFNFHRSSGGSVRTASLLSKEEKLDRSARSPPGLTQWQGLARYLDDDTGNEHHEWDDIEYARFSTLVDCKKVNMLFYWDVPGTVRNVKLDQIHSLDEGDANGCSPPEYGLNLAVEGGTVNYGPWADRQRVVLQNMFFPAAYHDARPAVQRIPGQSRIATVFKIHICLDKDVTIRVPTREQSKDSRWQGRSETFRKSKMPDPALRKRHGKRNKGRKQQQGTGGADVRPFGWIDVKVLADSTVNYHMDMYARKDGYHNSLDVDVKGTEIYSSVNHGLLWRAGNLSMDCDLSNPLKWNALRKWQFNIHCHDLDLFVLRDHMFLITDIVADWSAGPPPDFFTFVPFEYKLNLHFENFKLFLNTNDANIVNDPSDLEENNFLILQGDSIRADLSIPLSQYRPPQGEIKFDVLANALSLTLSNSPRITIHSLLHVKRVGELRRLTLNGSHTYYTEQSEGLTDLLRMDICGTDLDLALFGFLVRHFINVKENYFGDFLHFKTLEEFQNSEDVAAKAETTLVGRHDFRPVNDLDVVLCITAEHPVIKLPANIYSAESFVKIELPVVSADLRVTNYYLDLQTDVSPITISWSGLPGAEQLDDDVVAPQILVDGANITGHRLFGLPPAEPAYVSTWDVSLGNVSGDCSLEFVQHAAKAGRSFAFGLADRENAIPLAQTAPIHDITYVRLNTGNVCLWIHEDVAAIRIATQPLEMVQNDRAEGLFSARLTVLLPHLSVTCIEAGPAARHRARHEDGPVKCLAFLETTVELNQVVRRAHFHDERTKQQEHLRRQDKRSQRAQFMIADPQSHHDGHDSAHLDEHFGSPSLDLPNLAEPIEHVQTPLKLRRPSSMHSTGTRQTRDKKSSPEHLSAVAKPWYPLTGPIANPTDGDIDLSRVPTFVSGVEEDDTFSEISFNDEGLNLDLDGDVDHVTFLVRLRPGVRVYVEPRLSDPIINVVESILPKRAIDIMDIFQMDVMSTIEERQELRKSRGGITELNLHIPTIDIRVFNDETSVDPSIPQGSAIDQLDINLSYINLTLRSRSAPPDRSEDSAILLHLTIVSALITLADAKSQTMPVQHAVRLGVGDVLVWLMLSRTRSVHISFADLLTAVSGRQSSYITSCVSRYAAMGVQIQNRASMVASKARLRPRLLTDYLTDHATVSSDPPYLSRLTYILRAYSDHFRNQDSWKIVARFRHIFGGLGDDSRAELEDLLSSCPASRSKPSSILDTWAQWCSWDIPNVGQTVVFKTLLGDSDSQRLPKQAKPLELTLQGETIRFAVEFGTDPCEISTGSLSVALSVVPPSKPSGLMLVEENLRTKTIVQAHSAAFVLKLSWAILAEAEPLLDTYFDSIAPTFESVPNHGQQPGEDNFFRQDFHIVLSTDEGSIQLQSINLKHTALAQELKLSLVGTSRASAEYGECISTILMAKRASTELRGPSADIWQTELNLPSIYFDYRQRLNSTSVEINVGGSYDTMNIKIEKEILGLLEVINSVLGDEVSHVRHLQKHIANKQLQRPRQESTPKPQHIVQLNVAFLAGKFTFSAALLKALSFTVSGETSNLRIRPKAGPEISFDIEVYVGAMEHALVRKENGISGQRAVFHSPPASGNVGLDVLDEKISLLFSGILEQVVFEASSVQSAMTIIHRPEVQSVLEALRDQAFDLQRQVTKVFADEKPVATLPETKKSRALIYDLQITLEGFRVVATARNLSAGHAQAELKFGLGLVNAAVTNKDLPELTGVPNIHAVVHDLGAVLSLEERGKHIPCGHLLLSVNLDCVSDQKQPSIVTREVKARSDAIDVNVFAATASTVVDIVTHVQQKLLDLDLSREVEHLRRWRHSRARRLRADTSQESRAEKSAEADVLPPENLAIITNISVDLRKIRVAWIVTESLPVYGERDVQDLELTFTRISLSIKRQNEARLSIQNLQLQVIPKDHTPFERGINSALLPEVVFTVRYESKQKAVRIAFQAAGQALDLRLDSGFVVPVSILERSISAAVDKYQVASTNWRTEAASSASPSRASPFGDKRLVSLQADASFAGALVYIQGEAPLNSHAAFRRSTNEFTRLRPKSSGGGVGQNIIATSLRAPGIALKVEFSDGEVDSKESTLNGEMKVEPSSNTVQPEMVPIIMQISDSVKDVIRNAEQYRRSAAPRKALPQPVQKPAHKPREDDSLLNTDPSLIFGKTRLNLGLRICQQEFGLSCQPIARVYAKAKIEDIYITMSTINSVEFGHFFSLSSTITKLCVSVQHVYSRDSTLSFDMDSIAVSLMNSKHLSGGRSGLSAVIKIAPTRTALNVRQIQDLLLFREIWFPHELREASYATPTSPRNEPEEMLMHKYWQVSSSAAFPWNATIAIADLAIDLELGQSIGKSTFIVKNMWASSQKAPSGKEDLSIGIDEVGIKSTGRMSGFVELSGLAVATSIEWPSPEAVTQRAPLIQASIGVQKLRAKSSFDYQPFAFADIEAFSFLMYNVRSGEDAPDRLVAMLDGDKVFVFCTATSPAQAVGLYQAFLRLVQEKEVAYKESMREVQNQLQRRSVSHPVQMPHKSTAAPPLRANKDANGKSKITLHTDVVVHLRAISFGAFPGTFFDKQLLKLEALNVQARFAVGVEEGKIHSNLSMTLGQLQVALAAVKKVSVPKTLGDISIDEVIMNATNAKGGTILRVPKVVASMQTWHSPDDKQIDYIFKSSFEGKVDVGWNYSRISFIRGMWDNHTRTLAARLGKALPESALKITADREKATSAEDEEPGAHGKITAVVNVPQSTYQYRALEPPIIETPQLRDMGDATPPLEWIGLHRDRLPNVTHQIVIVTLLEVAQEVEDAYGRILGSS